VTNELCRGSNLKREYEGAVSYDQEIHGKYSKPERPVKDKQRLTITYTEKQPERWTAHSEEFFSTDSARKPSKYNKSRDRPRDINCVIRSKEDTIRAIKRLKNSKAAGTDGILAEALNADVESTADLLLSFLRGTVTMEKWSYHQTAQKGDLSNYENYRGITVNSWKGVQQDLA
jgi:hypothetical protein